MSLLTFIARVSDGLVLVASVDTQDEGGDIERFKHDARKIIRGLSPACEPKMSIDAGAYQFNYMIERGICYLTMCERDYPKRLAFAFLSDLRSEFESHLFAEHGDLWEQHVDSVRRPYAFIKFDRVIQRKRREYEDMSSQGNVQRLNDTLYDVHNVMRDNLQHVLKRGKKLDQVSEISRNLVDESKEMRWRARRLNINRWLRTYAPVIGVLLLVLLVIYYKFLA